MARKKKEAKTLQQTEGAQSEAPQKKVEVDVLQSQAGDSQAQTEYRALLEKYKEEHPEKYEQKKAEFARKLKGDITIEVSKGGVKTFKFTNVPSNEE